MMNSLNEAIKHCEEVADMQETQAEKYDEWDEWERNEISRCLECAKEHRQLAEWLRELKELRDFANFVAESVMEEDFEEDSSVYAEIFCRKLYKMGYMKSIDGKWIFNDEEVNADEDSN